jgi:hypothetical protein
MNVSNLENEWSVLQNQFDDYEKYSLIIKLVNIGLLSAAYFKQYQFFCGVFVTDFMDSRCHLENLSITN